MKADDDELLGRFKKTQAASTENKDNNAGKSRSKKRGSKQPGLLSPFTEAGSPSATGQGEEGDGSFSKKVKLDEKAGVPPPGERSRSDIANDYVNQWDKEIGGRDKDIESTKSLVAMQERTLVSTKEKLRRLE